MAVVITFEEVKKVHELMMRFMNGPFQYSPEEKALIDKYDGIDIYGWLIDKLTDFEEVKDSFLDLLNQHCGEHKAIYPEGWVHGKPYDVKFLGYDSMCLSANYNALELAARLRWIKKEEINR